MADKIVVEIEFTHGWSNRIEGKYYVSGNISYLQNDVKRISEFLSYAIKNHHNDIVVTVRNDVYLHDSFRFVLEDYKNGYQKRKFMDNVYGETPSITFGTEGNARKEMKKDIIKTIKEMAMKA